MKFICDRQALISAISMTSRAAGSKTAIQALEGLYLSAGDRLKMVSYNLETGITTHFDGDIIKPGEIVLPKLFGDIIRKLDSDTVEVTVDERSNITITGGASEFNISGMPADDYPELPVVESENSFSILAGQLKDMISETIFSVAESETRPIHTGCLFKLNPGSLTVVAVDSFRLAIRKEQNETRDEFSFVAPAVALKEVQRLVADDDTYASVSLGERHISFEIGDSCVVCRRLEGEFLDYERVIPTDSTILLVADTSQMISTLERVAIVINEQNKTHILSRFEDNCVKMTARTALGASSDVMDIAGDGGGLVFAFNHKYMLEALKNAPCSNAKLELSTSSRPCIIKPADPEDESFLYMIMPVRIKDN